MSLALVLRFYKWKKTFQIMSKSSSSKQKSENYGKKTSSSIISSSNKMKAPLNSSKKTQTFRTSSLKDLRNISKQIEV